MGTGHLARCLTLNQQLPADSFILKEAQGEELKTSDHPIAKAVPVKSGNSLEITHPGQQVTKAPGRSSFWDLIVLDRKATPLQEYLRLSQYGLVIGLDEGGAARSYLPYCIDTLPGLKKQHPANLHALTLLDLPRQKKPVISFPFCKILLTFGGEDAANLSGVLLNGLLYKSLFKELRKELKITLVQGPYFKQKNWPGEIHILFAPPNLKETLCQYDLVITSFGLTCFEALAAGVPVILFNPTPYHRALSRQARLPEIGVRTPNLGKLKTLFGQREFFERQRALYRQLFNTTGREEETLPGLLSQLASATPGTGSPAGRHRAGCPACSKPLNPVIARFKQKTYFRCRRCGLVYMYFFPLPKPVKNAAAKPAQKPSLLNKTQQNERYNTAYFFEEYKKQYGKTYLEDFPAIKKMGKKRLTLIKQLLRTKTFFGNRPGLAGRQPDLLDIGCALGPFLAAGAESGFKPWGMDISVEAVNYVVKKLGIPGLAADFEQLSLPDLLTLVEKKWQKKQFSVITMWYVIEHFKDLKSVLSKVNQLLPKGGVFAFSTPNGAGVSAKSAFYTFLEASPDDHYTIWTPDLAETILKSFGFRVQYIRPTGHHPERFPGLQGLKPGSASWSCLAKISRLLRWGDTFEVYAVKEKAL
jgi:2-polyprenyl-3-methyl-5-hydroxy-6-metoxy-1,4-benzoquinol methylase